MNDNNDENDWWHDPFGYFDEEYDNNEVISLCLGTYSPKALADVASGNNPIALNILLQYNSNATIDHPRHCDPYPVQLFLPNTFVEHPKMLRLVLAHCNRNKCPLSPSLRRTLLELTLAEWNQAKRSGDIEAEKLRTKEAITVRFYIIIIYFWYILWCCYIYCFFLCVLRFRSILISF